MGAELPGYENPQAARAYLLHLEIAETRLWGLGRGLAYIGCAFSAPSAAVWGMGDLMAIAPIENLGRGCAAAGTLAVAAGGLCAVYKYADAYIARRRMHRFVAGWLEAASAQTDTET